MMLSDGRRMTQLCILSHGIEVTAKLQIIALRGCSNLKQLLIHSCRFLSFKLLRRGRSLRADPLRLLFIPGQKLRLLLFLGSLLGLLLGDDKFLQKRLRELLCLKQVWHFRLHLDGLLRRLVSHLIMPASPLRFLRRTHEL